MSFFHHPNPAKLAANQDLHGLFVCVTGKDQAVAHQAAPLLAALADDLDGAPGTHEVVRDLESDAQPTAIHALACMLRHGFDRTTRVKTDAALSMYRLHALGELQAILAEVRESEHQGGALHAALSRLLLAAAVRGHDLAMVQFLLVNGCFGEAGEVAPAVELLGDSGDPDVIAQVVADPALFSAAVRQAGAAASTASAATSKPST